MRLKWFLWLILLFSLFGGGCEFYKAFKENREIADFLNGSLNVWVSEESRLLSQYNRLIAGEKFSSEILWHELDRNLIPKALALREEISRKPLEKKNLEKIRRMFLEKMDLFLEGFDLIREGLKKNEREDFLDMVFQGRDKLQQADRISQKIEEEIHRLMEEYYIRTAKKN